MQTLELDYQPYAYQAELHDSPVRWKIIAGGRRVGKSKMALMELIKHCIEVPKATAWWVAPTINTARDVGWKEMKDVVEPLAPIIKSMNETRMEVAFMNGSVLAFKGADNESSLRGSGLTYLVMDEAAFIKPDVWRMVLRPALSDRKGKAILISTPNGKNWFYETYWRAKAETRKVWLALHWTTMMNPLIDEEEIQDAMAMMDELSFRQEYLAEFITKQGQVYANFQMGPVLDGEGKVLDAGNVVPTGDFSVHDCDVYLGMDFGFANPTAICFMAVNRTTGTVTQFDELSLSRVSIDAIEQYIIGRLAQWGLSSYDVKTIYCDPAGNAQELTSGISPVDELRRSPMKWRVISTGSSIMEGVALVRSYIRNARGQRRFFISENCQVSLSSVTKYIYAKQNQTSETVKEEPLKDGINDHMCDAIRYFFVNHFDKAKYVANNIDFIDPYKSKEATGRPVLKRCQKCRRNFTSFTAKSQPPFKCKECLGEIDYV